LSLAKVAIAKMFHKIRRYELCSVVPACYVKSIVMCKLCVVLNEAELKKNAFDRLNVPFVVTLTEHFYHTFIHGPTAHSGPGPLTFESSKLHSVRHTTLGRTRLDE
jgi:hypothetical protein